MGENLIDIAQNIATETLSPELYARAMTAVEQLKDIKTDDVSIVCAYLHIPFLHEKISEDKVNETFGEDALNILLSLKKLHKLTFSNAEEEGENIRKMFFAISKDIRVVIIKLAYAYSNLKHINPEKENVVMQCEMAMRLYAPIASRLGLYSLASQIQDLSFKLLNPSAYFALSNQIDEKIKERLNIIDELEAKLKSYLFELKIEGRVYGRKKGIFSTYKKLKSKASTLDNIYDILAIRIIVNKTSECYTILGKIHSEMKFLQQRFKDYISIPKSNGYQSLHTTIIYNNVPVEIQIRTEDMHREAEYGVCVHWMYKEGRKKSDSLDEKLMWLRQVMDEQDKVSSSDLIDYLKVDIYEGEIFVQSPNGKVVHLPQGATPIDFAYAIHSQIGDKCVGAKVNGKMVPITSKLNSGDIVQIITSPASKGPSLDWLNYVKSVSAKSKIRNFFKKNNKEENIKLGKTMLEQMIKDKGYSPNIILSKDNLKNITAKFSFVTSDDLFAGIGSGAVPCKTVVVYALSLFKQKSVINEEVSVTSTTIVPNEKYVMVPGLDDSSILIKFAPCCKPMYGDEIVGYISHGRGIIVHRKICPHLSKYEENRLIPLKWKEKI